MGEREREERERDSVGERDHRDGERVRVVEIGEGKKLGNR